MLDAFVLHTRPFRNTSAIIDFFTAEQGRLSTVAKGVRAEKSKLKGLLQPFVALQIETRGKTELLTLTKVEPSASLPYLTGRQLWMGLYVNELFIRLLPKHEPHVEIFQLYHQLLRDLATPHAEIALRLFEKQLLKHLGFAVNFTTDAETHVPIEASRWYRFIPLSGFVATTPDPHLNLFPGSALQALAQDQFDDPSLLKYARDIMRYAFAQILPKSLHAREIFTKAIDTTARAD